MDSAFYRRLTRRFDLPRALRKLLKNRIAMALIVIVTIVLVYGVFGNHGIYQRWSLQHEKADLERKIKEANEETKQLQTQSKDLDSSKKAIEKVARERYGMAREGEHVYKVTGDKH